MPYGNGRLPIPSPPRIPGESDLVPSRARSAEVNEASRLRDERLSDTIEGIQPSEPKTNASKVLWPEGAMSDFSEQTEDGTDDQTPLPPPPTAGYDPKYVGRTGDITGMIKLDGIPEDEDRAAVSKVVFEAGEYPEIEDVSLGRIEIDDEPPTTLDMLVQTPGAVMNDGKDEAIDPGPRERELSGLSKAAEVVLNGGQVPEGYKLVADGDGGRAIVSIGDPSIVRPVDTIVIDPSSEAARIAAIDERWADLLEINVADDEDLGDKIMRMVQAELDDEAAGDMSLKSGEDLIDPEDVLALDLLDLGDENPEIISIPKGPLNIIDDDVDGVHINPEILDNL